VLTRAILGEGCKSVAAGMNPMDLRRGINLAVEHVVDDLKRRAKMISTTGEIAQARLLGGRRTRRIGWRQAAAACDAPPERRRQSLQSSLSGWASRYACGCSGL